MIRSEKEEYFATKDIDKKMEFIDNGNSTKNKYHNTEK